ncbi:phosphoribosylglycinamide formyltransferase [Enterococcus sp. CSURQ0835]|uniref:phosphoribosylglycinamide formyltransferase n=1 Tax=Enterococcus sp. CSURQ0835 TaxID=2681394 RepID=UPI00135698C2|nr:phosphoribosylglycinamide formyltransferase [Enterococcus sp. CSURQ0835]
MKIAVLASGNGSNFEAIANAIKTGELAAELSLVFSDHRDAFVLERAKKLGIPSVSFELKEFPDKKSYETQLLRVLQANEIELVVLAGYLRLIGPTLLAAFPQKILNLHPALLPDFPGLHGIKDAFEAGVSQTGVTVHYVDKGMDTGPVIAQAVVDLEPDETLTSLEQKIHAVEHRLYPQTIAQVIKQEKEQVHP